MDEILTQAWPALLIVGSALFIWWIARQWQRESYCPYVKRESIMTRNEQRFYRALAKAVEGQWSIFAMVRMADLLRVEPDATQRQAWQNRINSKHLDFVLCDRRELDPVLAIELDDRSHLRPDRVRRDEFVNDALASAGLPLLRVPAAARYHPDDIRAALSEFLTLRPQPRGQKAESKSKSRASRPHGKTRDGQLGERRRKRTRRP